MQVATVLAEEVRSDVCLVGAEEGGHLVHEAGGDSRYRRTGIRSKSGQVSSNLWTVSQDVLWEGQPGTSVVPGLCRQLEELKREFEYSVIQGPAAGTHRRAALLGQLCDGVVLVLQADSTRRVAAQRARELLASAGVKVLGTILCDRKFPIPDAIYRRL
jgi:Mrp family chromosome partitioning ATPase